MGEDEDYDEIIKECKAKKRDYEMDMDVIPVSFAIEHKSMQGNLKMLMERDGGNLLSFIILMALSDVKEPLNTTQISELIALHTKGQIYKISATLKDALEHRLKREGYVEGIDEKNKSLYSITPKGRKLLNGWIAFLSAYS